MIGLAVSIICIVISVFCYKKLASSCRNKGQGNVRAFLTASISSIFLFMITMGIGIANFFPSSDKAKAAERSAQDVATTNNNSNKVSKKIYTCDKFDAITQTRQGTKYNSGFYSDKNIHVTYTVTDSTLSTKLFSPGIDSSTESATFNKIADDGSRKYGNSSSNFFVYVLNDSTIKVITVNFNTNMTLTQMCSN
ncbi:hypothetical protein [Yersinia mollaretii]|uniref:hypothetical protein n=1 Tax=Yersinia mollaretii TaxID=33060 RepID=UPI0005E38F04|nr:hypothetical protein [Yersinia mollaretii]CNE43272.1 Uncharacterised protein [Yersinia mollaretii]CQJ08668.1 Uncharacterised protein [Yersinia mollaretii]